MDVQLRKSPLATRPAGLLAVFVPEGAPRLTGAALEFDRATKGALARVLAAGDFTGRHLETALLYPPGVKAKRVLLVGVGRVDALDEQRLRTAAAQASVVALGTSTSSLAQAASAQLAQQQFSQRAIHTRRRLHLRQFAPQNVRAIRRRPER